MKPEAIVFDLDGTLLNTLESLAGSYNHALQTMGFATHELDDYRYIIGDGAITAAKRALPPGHQSGQNVDKCLALFRDHYDRNWQTATVYPGIYDTLDGLADLPLAVLSNKDEQFTKQCVEHFFPDRFVLAVGASSTISHKPDPSGAEFIARSLNTACSSLWLVGDTATDMKTATASGMSGIGVLWGFRDREELAKQRAQHIIDAPAELLSLLET